MKVHELGLDAETQAIAEEFEREFPGCEFTSGARELRDQARAMAQNTAVRRTWIAETYKDSLAKNALVAWLRNNPQAKSAAAIERGFYGALSGFPYSELCKLSLHLGRRAFDVLPKAGALGLRMCAVLRALALKYGGTFLEKEGGLIRWHFQLPLNV